MCEVFIRYARPDDITALVDVHFQAWQKTYSEKVPELAEITPKSYFKKYWTGLFDTPDNRVGIIAENEFGDIMGFISYGPTTDFIINKADLTPDRIDDVAEIEKLYVNVDLPSERKEKGIAYRLFAHAMNDMHNNNYKEMLVRSFSFNKLAVGFYSRQSAVMRTEDPFLMLQTREVPGERPYMVYTPNILFHLPSIKGFLMKENVIDLLDKEPMLNMTDNIKPSSTSYKKASGHDI